MPSKDAQLRQAKEKGRNYLAKGKYDKALKQYEKVLVLEKDTRNKQKLADVLAKAGKGNDAIKLYRECAKEYGDKGFLIQAISVTKLILEIDPNRADVKQELNELYAQRGITGKKAAPTAAARKKSPAADLPQFETPLFSGLTAEEFPRVVEKFQVGRIPKGTTIIKEGTEGDAFFILAHGKVRVYKESKSGRKVTLTYLEDGAFFGEFAFLTRSARTASIDASEECVLLRINRQDLEDLIAEYPRIQEVMDEFYRQRVLDTLLSISPLFEALEPNERQEVIARFEPESFSAGDVIIEEGAEGRGLFLIRSGHVEVSTVHELHGKVKLATLGEGDFFGEISLLRNQKTTATVAAEDEVDVLVLPRDAFQEVIMTYPQILEAVGAAVEERLQSTIKTLTSGVKQKGAA